ncbi:hypothetical protein CAPTEDRAFT_199336 [Capitella teleta]|uniref:Uncharacterized protein n=1 Tax=Capitella teleta TaxID=283909 RepID=R7TUN0_CAPTE|nr:hypothetical protein CAPTEDRAFT_199336 [Capitella teleta]|eukprot:ELT97277.1 hypothetical protein CAPTEDRAFT_199336 [Capitella teleta]
MRTAQTTARVGCLSSTTPHDNQRTTRAESFKTFYDVKRLCDNLRVQQDTKGERVRWREIRTLAVQKESPTTAYFTYGHTDLMREIDLTGRSRRFQESPMVLKQLRNQRIPLSAPKYQDIMNLCNEMAIPPNYQSFFAIYRMVAEIAMMIFAILAVKILKMTHDPLLTLID